MKLRNMVAGASAMFALLGSVSFAQDVDLNRSHPKAFVKDSAITAKVKTKLASEHLSSLAKIHVETDADGIVWLTGTAPTHDAVERAVTLARATEGVVSVKSDIHVAGDHD